MRKLKLQMQLSINGFVAGPKGEMDWLTWNWGDDIKSHVTKITEPVDCIILGRKLADGFIPYWAIEAANPKNTDIFAQKMNSTPKVVFSKTLEKSLWENTKLAKGDLIEEINNLKKQPGNDIIVYGGANFVSNLILTGLIDELHFFINPVAVGNGMSIFKELTNLKLVNATTFDCGIVDLQYQQVNK